MCGIAGICRLTDSDPITLDAVTRMIAVQHHRGPDETGFYLDDRVALGQSRLSIIDLAGGTQPVHNEDQTLWIVYNGEVFNYPELRADLVAKGHRFYTTCDTEVLVHLFEEKGAECLSLLNGQFAFAIWNGRTNELFCARDRIGIRPFHYTVHNDRLLFASEIKALFTAPDLSRRLDPVALDQIFTFWTTLRGRTAFEGISELPPGHYMHVANGKVDVRPWWTIPFCPHDEQCRDSLDDITAHVSDLLHDAIKIRLRADVPVGCYLSGGLDSSGITAKVVRNFNSRVRTFGIRFEEHAFDEGSHQRLMVDHLKVDHQEIVATNALIGQSFPHVVRHCEKPILRTAPAPLFLLSDLVHRSGFKVVLTGEGADEFFGGYNIFREAKVRRFWSRQPGSASRPDLLGRLYPYIFKNPRLVPSLRSFLGKGLDEPDSPFFSHLVRWENTAKCRTFFSQDLKSRIGEYSGRDELLTQLPPKFQTWDYYSRAQYLESTIFLSNYLLSSQGDRVAMAHSLEIRVPFLDYRIMEYMARVPSRWKTLGLDEKHLLKKVFRDLLPAPILHRAKNPYRAPIRQSLLSGPAGDYAEDLLSESALKASGLFDPARVAMLVKKSRMAGEFSETDNMALVAILSSQLLHRQFVGTFDFDTTLKAAPTLIIGRRTAPDRAKDTTRAK